VWQPAKCIHSMNCFKGLPQVFDPNKRPWANAEGATTEQIVNQIKNCPSGALSYEMDNAVSSEGKEGKSDVLVEPAPNGPLMVYGNLTVKGSDGTTTKKAISQPFADVEIPRTNPIVTVRTKK